MTANSGILLLLSLLVIVSIAQSCKQGWHVFEDSCYGFGGSQVTWGDAQELCIAFNGKLAEIETAEENAFLKDLARNKRVAFVWLGGSDILDEGVWEWTSSRRQIFPFLDWASNQPDEGGHDEDCLTLYQSVDYQWNDYYCYQLANFICEAPSDDMIVG